MTKKDYDMKPTGYIVRANNVESAKQMARERMKDLSYKGERYIPVFLDVKKITKAICTEMDEVTWFNEIYKEK